MYYRICQGFSNLLYHILAFVHDDVFIFVESDTSDRQKWQKVLITPTKVKCDLSAIQSESDHSTPINGTNKAAMAAKLNSLEQKDNTDSDTSRYGGFVFIEWHELICCWSDTLLTLLPFNLSCLKKHLMKQKYVGKILSTFENNIKVQIMFTKLFQTPVWSE